MPDPGPEMLGHLPEASHDLAPDDVVAAVARAGKALDAEDVAICLVDYEQTLLVPLPDGTDRTPLGIDTTLAGQPAAETMRRLAHAILARQGAEPRDDATMVFLEWPGPPGELARGRGSDTRQ